VTARAQAPRIVIALGDSFHDAAHERLSAPDRERALAALQARRDWIWIAGNHDPALPSGIGGVVAKRIRDRRAACSAMSRRGAAGEIAGHLHPKARVASSADARWSGAVSRATASAVMPAFGAYTGGLSIRDRAFADVFGTLNDDLRLLRRAAIVAGHLDVRRLHIGLAGLHHDRCLALQFERERALQNVNRHGKTMGMRHGLVARLERRGQDAHELPFVARQSFDHLLQDHVGFGEACVLLRHCAAAERARHDEADTCC
jgi:3',5'-cyclic AMP phosphodiesterase CpdA